MKTPLSKHYKGLPCMMGDVVARVVGEDESGSWLNDIHSVPLIATPHGTVLRSGRAHLTEIDEEGMIKLLQYEKIAKEQGVELYAGRLTDEEISKV